MEDQVRKDILSCAVQELFRLFMAVKENADIADKPFKLFLLGGVLQNSIYI
ncbi:hypothetical protein [Virgibacillus doumboii]|uniref:hypothetical protein n=1 Tax=Virgibacillus doumboii TaxID=2697503 RepID=UPI0013DFB2CC|nr:hypothetical protein [Virgibacillus doumboii]